MGLVVASKFAAKLAEAGLEADQQSPRTGGPVIGGEEGCG